MKRSIHAAVGATLLALSGLASAQYPTKPLRLVVGTAVSTPIDILSRVVADKLGAGLGQSVVVENRVGAGGTVGAQEVLRSPSDGYTLMNLFMPMTVVQTVMADVNYQLARDFAAIGQFAWSPDGALFAFNAMNKGLTRDEIWKITPGAAKATLPKRKCVASTAKPPHARSDRAAARDWGRMVNK